MKDYLRRNWWLYLILILACAALPLIQRWEAVPVLSPPSFVFTWYAAVIPIAAAAAAAVTSARRDALTSRRLSQPRCWFS